MTTSFLGNASRFLFPTLVVLACAAQQAPAPRIVSLSARGAKEILKLNTVAYPNSPNVYDSLADAYLADGQKDLAYRALKRLWNFSRTIRRTRNSAGVPSGITPG